MLQLGGSGVLQLGGSERRFLGKKGVVCGDDTRSGLLGSRRAKSGHMEGCGSTAAQRLSGQLILQLPLDPCCWPWSDWIKGQCPEHSASGIRKE